MHVRMYVCNNVCMHVFVCVCMYAVVSACNVMWRGTMSGQETQKLAITGLSRVPDSRNLN